MQKMFKVLLIVTFGVLLLAGCAQPTATPTVAATQTPAAATTEAVKTEAALTVSATLAATEAATGAAPADGAVLNVMTHDSFNATEEDIAKFEADNKVKLNFLKSGDTGSALNRAILSKDSPLADVFYGVDNTFLSRALTSGIFEPYASPLLKEIDPAFLADKENRALPVDYGDVCINYDKDYFKDKNLAVPATLDDLLKLEYKGLLAVENPSMSSPGLAFLLATIAQYGEEGYVKFWQDLRANGLVVVNDWETAYYTNFSASSGKGPQPMVVSYASSPAAEVIFAEQKLEDSPTASLLGDNMCYRQIEFVGILKGTKNRALAEKFIDFMLGKEFQSNIPMQMFVYPVNKNAMLPEEFTRYSQTPAKPASLPGETIEAKREEWIKTWDKTVLK